MEQETMFPLEDEERERLTRRLREAVLEKERRAQAKRDAAAGYREEIKALDEEIHRIAVDLRDDERARRQG